jgi:agmatinase
MREHDRWGRVSMIHFDAHADTGDIEFGSLWVTDSRCAG